MENAWNIKFPSIPVLATAVINYIKNVADAPAQTRKPLAALVQARGLLSMLVDLIREVDDQDWLHTIQSLSAPNSSLSTFKDLLEQVARKLGQATSSSNLAIVLDRL
ncbi:hypothetical protein EMPG_14272 [Blastomyces silverae]|uniref:Uncharacterized protein n=1 Tax=Blastomyces silverae TaxID=2060906 RepID=A0A0H1BGY9_9EURO|nr:hypothetical protein EMPG_14272 [Blastomyces silverae]